MIRPGKISAYTTTQAVFVARHGSRGRLATEGMSAVTSASSAYVRDAYT